MHIHNAQIFLGSYSSKFKMYVSHLETAVSQGWAKSVRIRVTTLLVHWTSGRCGDKTVKCENTKRNIAIFYYSHSSHELFAQLPWHRRWDFIIFPLPAMCSCNNVNLISPDSWLCFVHVSGIKLFSPAQPTKYLKAINNQKLLWLAPACFIWPRIQKGSYNEEFPNINHFWLLIKIKVVFMFILYYFIYCPHLDFGWVNLQPYLPQ